MGRNLAFGLQLQETEDIQCADGVGILVAVSHARDVVGEASMMATAAAATSSAPLARASIASAFDSALEGQNHGSVNRKQKPTRYTVRDYISADKRKGQRRRAARITIVPTRMLH